MGFRSPLAERPRDQEHSYKHPREFDEGGRRGGQLFSDVRMREKFLQAISDIIVQRSACCLGDGRLPEVKAHSSKDFQ